jgi:aspartyl/asparaginyl-tRNA synthetase
VATTSAPPPDATAGIERTFVSDLPKRVGERVLVNGWLSGQRRAKTVRFLNVRDRSGTVQCVYRDGEASGDVSDLTLESAVRVIGTVKEGGGRYGAVEVEIDEIEVLARAETPLPLDGSADPETRLDHRHLDLRPRDRFIVFEVQTTLEDAMRDFVIDRGFIELHSPKLTAGGSESGATVFEVPYFGETAVLVQSPQFYMQMGMAAGFDRVFEIGPVFRNEPGVTNRHATEFTIAHFELSWIESHQDLITLHEDLLRYALSVVEEVHGRDVERYCGIEVEVPREPIPRISLADASELTGETIEGAGGRVLHRVEQALSKYAQERYGHSFVFLTNYLASDRPFYTMREEAEPGQPVESRSFDLLWRGLEITSGAQREHRHDRLRAQIAESGLESDQVSRYLDPYYLDMFRYGCPPHGGFGFGVNRLVMSLLAQPSMRETSFVFRGPGRFVP